MNIYLDIDGVLLKKDCTLANHFDEFLEFLLNNHNVYWLTTHCRGGQCDAIEHIARNNNISEKSLENLKKIKLTDWYALKNEAIDFSKDFRWLDDFIFEKEKEVLEKNGALQKAILINLKENPNQLLDLTKKIY